MTAAILRRALAGAGLALALAGCAKSEPRWTRPDVGAEATREVELDCHQRSILAFDPGNDPQEAQAVHVKREAYFERCMRGSGFELKAP